MNYFERLITYEKLNEYQRMNLQHPKIKKDYKQLTKKIKKDGIRPKDERWS